MKGKGKASSVLVTPKGSAPPTEFPGKAVMQAAKESSKGFKKGGQVAGGDCGPGRMDKAPRKARGGAATMRGRSPMSGAASTSMPGGGTTH